jgi:uncharacterized protein
MDVHAQVQQFAKMLKNLDGWLEKAGEHAKAKKFDPNVLVQARLAPDMFPLTNQVQSACDGAKFLAARLSGREAPKHPDTEQTLDQLRARIASVLEYLAGFGPEAFAGWDARVIPLGFMPGKGLLAIDWATGFNVPNTYFHVVMAYAILRHNGVELGKTDYIGAINIRDL